MIVWQEGDQISVTGRPNGAPDFHGWVESIKVEPDGSMTMTLTKDPPCL